MPRFTCNGWPGFAALDLRHESRTSSYVANQTGAAAIENLGLGLYKRQGPLRRSRGLGRRRPRFWSIKGELVAKGGLYAELFSLQAAGYR